MLNPFKYGSVVSGKDFADREVELNYLVTELKSGQNIIFYSPRRYGKTSLILKVLEELKKNDYLTAYIDLYNCVFVSDLIDKIIKETVIPAYGSLDKVSSFFRSSLSGINPQITIKPEA